MASSMACPAAPPAPAPTTPPGMPPAIVPPTAPIIDPTVSGTIPARSEKSLALKPSSSMTTFLPVNSMPRLFCPASVSASLPPASRTNPSSPTFALRIASLSPDVSPNDNRPRSLPSAPDA